MGRTARPQADDLCITVNAVAPGLAETDIITAMPDKVKNKLLDQIPMRRSWKSEEIARACVYRCS